MTLMCTHKDAREKGFTLVVLNVWILTYSGLATTVRRLDLCTSLYWNCVLYFAGFLFSTSLDLYTPLYKDLCTPLH